VIRPGPPPDPDAVHAVARWCAGLADALTEVGRQLERLAEQITHDWADDRGRDWAERSTLLRRELGREAVAAAELGEVLARRAADDTDLDGPVPPLTASLGAGLVPRYPGPGMRLGGTDATRVDDDRGMRIAELPAPGAEPG